MLPLSVVIIAKNEELLLPQTIKSVAMLTDDILICDTGSTDNTINTAIENGARAIHLQWEGFGITKNKANQFARYNWILQLDADETADEQLIKSLYKINFADEDLVYKVKRSSFFMGKCIRYGAWKNDLQIRLFHRGNASWNNHLVHERLQLGHASRITQLNGTILHKTVQSVSQYRDKMNEYAILSAQQYLLENKSGALWKQFVSPPFSFIRNYVVRLGFLDGPEGFTLAWLTAQYTFKKYAALQRMQRNQS